MSTSSSARRPELEPTDRHTAMSTEQKRKNIEREKARRTHLEGSEASASTSAAMGVEKQACVHRVAEGHRPKEERVAVTANHDLQPWCGRPWSTPWSPSSPPPGDHGGAPTWRCYLNQEHVTGELKNN